jgi:hypothetical protein
MVYLKFVIYASIDIMLNLGFIYFLILHGYLPLELKFIDIYAVLMLIFSKTRARKNLQRLFFWRKSEAAKLTTRMTVMMMFTLENIG